MSGFGSAPPGAAATGRTSGCRNHGDRGQATAELAVGLPALMLLTIVALTAVAAALANVQCVDAAREAARASARGQSGVVAAMRVAPIGASIQVSHDGDLVRAEVREVVHPLGGWLPGITISAVAVAAVEPATAMPSVWS
jgi:TadE-like protein